MLNQFTLPVKILATVINSNFGLLRFFLLEDERKLHRKAASLHEACRYEPTVKAF